jgi:tRNA pseudouridine(38-40) synthase
LINLAKNNLRIGLEISYDGTSFLGWQKQTGGGTVQQVLEEKLSILAGTSMNIIGCGRTDTGVHAKQFYVHLDLEDSALEKINLYHLNSILPWDISVNRMFQAGQIFTQDLMQIRGNIFIDCEPEKIHFQEIIAIIF